MKLTRALRTEINTAVHVACGSRRVSEVGYREINGRITNNALDWTDDSDLFDKTRLADVSQISECGTAIDCALLDIYAYELGRDGELDTNVYVFIRDGHVIGATQHTQDVERVRASLNFPQTQGW